MTAPSYRSFRDITAGIFSRRNDDPIKHIFVLTYEFDDQQLQNLVCGNDLETDFELRQAQLKVLCDIRPVVIYDSRKTPEAPKLPQFLELHPWRSGAWSCHHSKAYLIVTATRPLTSGAEAALPIATTITLPAAFAKRFPKLEGAVKTMLHRGALGRKGGLVVLDTNDGAQIAREFASRTGWDYRETMEMFESVDGAGVHGIYDPKTGTIFAVGPNLDEASLPAVILLGARSGRYAKNGAIAAHPPSSIPFLALGAWILTVGWFGFNVMSAQTLDKISGLVALNSLMAMVGGTLMALLLGKNDPGFVHNGPLAGLVAVCAGSDVMHPIGALAVGGVAGALFVVMFTLTQNRWRIDDVLGVWPLHGLCGAWGGIAAGIFGQKALGGAGGVAFMPQLLMTGLAIGIALVGSFIVYGLLKAAMGLRLDREEEFNGADLSIHRITATPEREPNW